MDWDERQLADLLRELRQHRGDTAEVEIKRAQTDLPRNIGETICAFANMPAGGTIILGVDEAAGFTVTGVTDPSKVEQGLVSVARNGVSPSPQLNFQTFKVSGAQLVVAEVVPLPLSQRPARYKGHAYLRQADGDYRMQDHELRLIELSKLNTPEIRGNDEQELSQLDRSALDPELVAQYLQNIRRQSTRRLSQLSDEEILNQTMVLTAAGHPTLAGLYAMGKYPQGAFPMLTVTAAVQLEQGTGNTRLRAKQDFDGPIPALLEDLMDWCSREIPEVSGYTSKGHLRIQPELPLEAIRELVANALVHRDLSANTLGYGKAIQVRLTSKGFFIQSPGGLRGVSIEQLRSSDHAQAAVNQRLYQICKHLRTKNGESIIEGEGGGVSHVYRQAEDYGLPTPELIDFGVRFQALLWNSRAAADVSKKPPVEIHPESVQVASDQPANNNSDTPAHAKLPLAGNLSRNAPAVIAALQKLPGKQADTSTLVEQTGLSRGQVLYALRDAIANHLVEMEGGQGKRNTTYRLPADTLNFSASS